MKEKLLNGRRRGAIAAGVGLLLLILMLCRPEDAVNGAREAMAQWYYAVAPSLLPFVALLPLLTGREACVAYERLLGGLMRRAFDLPGGAASVVAIGMLAGSPAGCVAARRAAVSLSLDDRRLERLAAACCGFSPGFLVSGVGLAMLGSAGRGWLLFRSQVAAQVALLLLLRLADGGERERTSVASTVAEAGNNPMRDAVLAVLTVCGYMTFFGAVCAALRAVMGDAAGVALTCVLDAPSGIRTVADLPVGGAAKMVLISGVAGFGGVCACMQNLGALKGCGVRPARFVGIRLLAGLISAGVTGFQLAWMRPDMGGARVPVIAAACACAAFIAIPAVFQIGKRELNI